MSDKWWVVTKIENLKVEALTPITFNDMALVFYRNHQDHVSCFHDLCSHQDIKLSDFGEIMNGDIICHAHGAHFCPLSGDAKTHPAEYPLRKVECMVQQGEVMIKNY